MQYLRRFRFPIKLRYLFIPFLFYHYPQPKYQMKEAIQLNQKMFVQDILGNSKDYFFLIIYKEQVDGGIGEKGALEISKKLSDISHQLGGHINVYLISRPSMTSISKLVNRVKGIKIYEEEDSQSIEIYLKTPYSDDYVYFPFNEKKFFTEAKQEKMLKRTQRFQHIIETVNNSQQLNEFLLQSFYQIDSPLFIKANTQSKKTKHFKKMAFQLLERKLVNQNSKFILIDNQELIQQLNLENEDIVILRNDILQKYQNCVVKDQFIQPQLVEKCDDLYKKVKLHSFNQWKNDNNISIELKYKQFYGNIKEFLLPRIIYMRNSKKSTIGGFIQKTQNCKKNKDTMILSLQIDPHNQNRIDVQNNKQIYQYQCRLQTFFKLYEKYQNQLIFVISATNQVQELLPHLNVFHSNFTLFNIYNQITHTSNHFEKPASLYEKYFLKDSQWIERQNEIEQQIEHILYKKNDNFIDHLSYDQDRIQEINLDYLNYLRNNKKDEKNIILYSNNDIMTDGLLQILKNIKTDKKIFIMSNNNQIPQLLREFKGQNVLLLGNNAIGMPIYEDFNILKLQNEIQGLINKYL